MSAVPMTTTDPLQRAVAFANVFDPLLYARKGHTVMAGDTVAVRVYCTRPLQVVTR
jgi:hypothetical protein